MVEKKAKDLKEGDVIEIYGDKFKVKKIEFSNIGKHGKSKCRIETANNKGEEKVIIRVTDDVLEVV